jgi:cobalt-zinc-cadmium efflux system protein
MTRVHRLVVVLALNVVLIAGLVVVGLTAHSLGVLAAGADYLGDAAAIAVSLFAIWLAARPPTAKRPHGYPKATAIAALVNGGWLLILSAVVTVGAVDRLATRTPHVHGLPVLVVSAIAAIVMVVGVVILGGDTAPSDDPSAADRGVEDRGVEDRGVEDHRGALNMRAVVLDTAGDAAAAAGVAATGGVILVTGRFYWLDPAVALAIAVVVGVHAGVLLSHVARALRQPA